MKVRVKTVATMLAICLGEEVEGVAVVEVEVELRGESGWSRMLSSSTAVGSAVTLDGRRKRVRHSRLADLRVSIERPLILPAVLELKDRNVENWSRVVSGVMMYILPPWGVCTIFLCRRLTYWRNDKVNEVPLLGEIAYGRTNDGTKFCASVSSRGGF